MLGLMSYLPADEKDLTCLEGQEYIMQDGDVVDFRFNVLYFERLTFFSRMGPNGCGTPSSLRRMP